MLNTVGNGEKEMAWRTPRISGINYESNLLKQQRLAEEQSGGVQPWIWELRECLCPILVETPSKQQNK